MAFTLKELSTLGSVGGTGSSFGPAKCFTLWHYAAPSIAEVFEAGYFSPAAELLVQGDHIHVSAPDGAAVLAVARAPGRRQTGAVVVASMSETRFPPASSETDLRRVA